MADEEEIYNLLSLNDDRTPYNTAIERDLRAIGYALVEIMRELKQMNNKCL